MGKNFCIETINGWVIAGTIIYIIKVVIPLIIIASSIMKLISIIKKGDTETAIESTKSIIVKIFIGILIFFIPSLLNITFKLLVDEDYERNYETCNTCLLDPSSTKCEKALKEYKERRKKRLKDKDIKVKGSINTDDLKDAETKDDNGDNQETNDNTPSTKNRHTIGKRIDLKDINHAVGICYSTWFNPISSNARLISSGNLKPNQFYYWGEPELGFYSSNNKKVIKQHMRWLNEANIDFIIIDNTNVSRSWKSSNYWNQMVTESMNALLSTINEMNSNNEATPKVVNWINTNNGSGELSDIYNTFYKNSKYDNIWLYYNNKPFILTTSAIQTGLPITTRKMWGLQPSLQRNEWSFLQQNNDKPSYNSEGKIEQIGVSVASQATYMSVTRTAKGRRGGKTFNEQWQTAFKYQPIAVTITWWNEWAAQYINGNFTDLYNQEYSRDIEPMKGGHGRTYYNWMKQYISAYKSNKSCPNLISE